MFKLSFLFLLFILFLSGCNVNSQESKSIDIDFSDPPDRLSVETKNPYIYEANLDNLYRNKGGILVSKPCDDWYVATQADPDSNSMDSVFDYGNSVIMCPIGNYTIKLGDIVEFNRENHPRTVSHRVIDMNATHYWIKGDNLEEIEIIPKEDVIGYVIGVIY